MKKAVLVILGLVFAFIVLVILLFSIPAIKFQWQTRRWEAQIKQREDPEKLRAWAKALLERYRKEGFHPASIVTNFPPVSVNIRHEFTSIYYSELETNEQANFNPAQDFVEVGCDFGAWTGAWGLKIGETNFVSSNPQDAEWKPGIYFFRFGAD